MQKIPCAALEECATRATAPLAPLKPEITGWTPPWLTMTADRAKLGVVLAGRVGDLQFAKRNKGYTLGPSWQAAQMIVEMTCRFSLHFYVCVPCVRALIARSSCSNPRYSTSFSAPSPLVSALAMYLCTCEETAEWR